MSTVHRCEKQCAVCKTNTRQMEVVSTNAFGPSDLDLRPPEMKRSTMVYWPEHCPHCGYTAYDIQMQTTISKDFLESNAYTTCEGICFSEQLAIRFYEIYMVARKTGNHRWSTNALLNAAWACDDAGDQENAVHCRKLLIPYLQQQIAANPQEAEVLMVVKADVMRRAGLFSELAEEYQNITFSEDIHNNVLAFELARAAEKDDSRYTMADI